MPVFCIKSQREWLRSSKWSTKRCQWFSFAWSALWSSRPLSCKLAWLIDSELDKLSSKPKQLAATAWRVLCKKTLFFSSFTIYAFPLGLWLCYRCCSIGTLLSFRQPERTWYRCIPRKIESFFASSSSFLRRTWPKKKQSNHKSHSEAYRGLSKSSLSAPIWKADTRSWRCLNWKECRAKTDNGSEKHTRMQTSRRSNFWSSSAARSILDTFQPRIRSWEIHNNAQNSFARVQLCFFYVTESGWR